MDIEKFAAAVAPAVRASIERATAPLLERIAALEAREMPQAIQGEPGKDGKDGRDGKDGADGTSVSLEDVERMVEGKVAGWALDFERRAQGVLERAIDRIPRPADGKDGRDGVDGIGFDDLTVEQSGERGMVIRFARGAEVKEFALAFPVVVDRGVYKDGSAYEQGDAVTWGGSLWIAQKDSPEGKPGMGDGWRLAVKKGRDGKDAK